MVMCDKYTEMLSAYADGELNKEEAAELEAHLKACADCRYNLKAYREIALEISEETEEPPDGFVQQVMDKVKAASRRKRTGIITRWACAAACVALVIFAAPQLSNLGCGAAMKGMDTAAPMESNGAALYVYEAAKSDECTEAYVDESQEDCIDSDAGTFDGGENVTNRSGKTESSHAQYQYGDTTPTWNIEIAAQYPSDEDCTSEQLLQKWLAVEGLTLDDLDERGCSQLLLTVALTTDGVETTNICYERQDDGSWSAVPALSWLPGHVAKYGIAHNRTIDSYTSPAGLWALGMAFGNEKEPDGLMLPWRAVTPNSDWVCDTESSYFNTWQERDDPNLEESWEYDAGEHLADYPNSYAYACVIEFNLAPDIVPSRGCAIFLHCGDDYTAGCVSLPEPKLLQVLLWLDPTQNPFILITGNPQS